MLNKYLLMSVISLLVFLGSVWVTMGLYAVKILTIAMIFAALLFAPIYFFIRALENKRYWFT